MVHVLFSKCTQQTISVRRTTSNPHTQSSNNSNRENPLLKIPKGNKHVMGKKKESDNESDDRKTSEAIKKVRSGKSNQEIEWLGVLDV